MKVRIFCATILVFTLLSTAAFAQYQTGKIIKVEQQQTQASSGGSDAALKAAVVTYHISIQIADKVYVCNYKTYPERDISWIEGKEVQARVADKVMFVKSASGKDVKGSILKTMPAATQ